MGRSDPCSEFPHCYIFTNSLIFWSKSSPQCGLPQIPMGVPSFFFSTSETVNQNPSLPPARRAPADGVQASGRFVAFDRRRGRRTRPRRREPPTEVVIPRGSFHSREVVTPERLLPPGSCHPGCCHPREFVSPGKLSPGMLSPPGTFQGVLALKLSKREGQESFEIPERKKERKNFKFLKFFDAKMLFLFEDFFPDGLRRYSWIIH